MQPFIVAGGLRGLTPSPLGLRLVSRDVGGQNREADVVSPDALYRIAGRFSRPASNVGHLMLLLQFGNMSKDLVKYNTQLFSEKVMPQLHDVFSEWEDRWWPTPMDRSERAPLSPFQPALAAE
jgi:hypothetical protein